ncbi:hypothetical protein ABG067_002072 [Albugo candida]
MHANLAYFHFAKQLLSLISVEAEKNLNGFDSTIPSFSIVASYLWKQIACSSIHSSFNLIFKYHSVHLGFIFLRFIGTAGRRATIPILDVCIRLFLFEFSMIYPSRLYSL